MTEFIFLFRAKFSLLKILDVILDPWEWVLVRFLSETWDYAKEDFEAIYLEVIPNEWVGEYKENFKLNLMNYICERLGLFLEVNFRIGW